MSRWIVRGAVVLAALTWFMFRQVEDLPTDITGPGPDDVAGVTVAPPTEISPPPVDEAGPWVVYAVSETYRDDEGRLYVPVVREAACVPAADLAAGVAEGALPVWLVPMPENVTDVDQGEACPLP